MIVQMSGSFSYGSKKYQILLLPPEILPYSLLLCFLEPKYCHILAVGLRTKKRKVNYFLELLKKKNLPIF